MLLARINALDGAPSAAIDAFHHGKAMAIAELRERVAFINRGQGWVVKKLREMLPRVRDDELHTRLPGMLQPILTW